MFKKSATIIGITVVIGLLGLFALGSVFAEGPTPTSVPQTPWHGAWGSVCRGAGVISDAITKLLGMTPEQICRTRCGEDPFADRQGEGRDGSAIDRRDRRGARRGY